MAIIDKPSDYFNTVLYTGTESSGKTVTGVGFQPDWIWIKNRTDSSNHNLYDSVRGGNGTSHYFLKSNASAAEGTNTSALLTIDSDGFTLGDGNEVNGNSDNMVSWNWKAGTSFTNDASSTGIGSLDSSGSVNETAGFSIVKYTGNGSSGATIKHGLSTVPTAMFIRVYDAAAGFQVYNVGLGNTKIASYLNVNEAGSVSAGPWNNTTPTSSVFTVGNGGNTNNNGGTHIAYVFSERQGYSKFGVYTGNGNADGPMIVTGMKPAWVMFKRYDSTSNWTMLDTTRSPHNLMINELYANHPNVESQNGRDIDCLSNGIKIRSSSAEINASGGTYTFYAFAENPFVTSTGVPATAR